MVILVQLQFLEMEYFFLAQQQDLQCQDLNTFIYAETILSFCVTKGMRAIDSPLSKHPMLYIVSICSLPALLWYSSFHPSAGMLPCKPTQPLDDSTSIILS